MSTNQNPISVDKKSFPAHLKILLTMQLVFCILGCLLTSRGGYLGLANYCASVVIDVLVIVENDAGDPIPNAEFALWNADDDPEDCPQSEGKIIDIVLSSDERGTLQVGPIGTGTQDRVFIRISAEGYEIYERTWSIADWTGEWHVVLQAADSANDS